MAPSCQQVALVPALPHTAKQLPDQSCWHHEPDLYRPAQADHPWGRTCSKTRLAWIKGSLAPGAMLDGSGLLLSLLSFHETPKCLLTAFYGYNQNNSKKDSGERPSKVSLDCFWMTFSKDFLKVTDILHSIWFINQFFLFSSAVT